MPLLPDHNYDVKKKSYDALIISDNVVICTDKMESHSFFSAQFVDIYAAGSGGLKLFGCTCAHPYNVLDVDWCAYERNALLSCSMGDPVKCWDLRDLRRPSLQLQVVGGAEQAKWAPLTCNLLSTTHGTDLRLWDNRVSQFFRMNAKIPVRTLSAHVQKVSCLAWHPTDATCFVTSGLDGYIKVMTFHFLRVFMLLELLEVNILFVYLSTNILYSHNCFNGDKRCQYGSFLCFNDSLVLLHGRK
ncbi:unnamed protein product [Gongylonema pulchrum]|uniref:WD_REPEATS_REGION domain-containing protein n=1 Tax=Gongylonema pulchrum TaxID=637853 RepID=A0A183D696_9BILA|nr:unnamed protein product [Gongylonema pulchrum]